MKILLALPFMALLLGCAEKWTSGTAIVQEVRVLVEREPSTTNGDTPGNAIAAGSVGYVIAGPVGGAFGAVAESNGPVPNGHSAKITACSITFIVEGKIWYLRPDRLYETEIKSCALLRKGDVVGITIMKDRDGRMIGLSWNNNSLSTTR